MKPMKPNIKLMKRLRTRFRRMRHPEHFNMAEVVVKTLCGTAMCIAGHTLDLEGYKYYPPTDDWFTPKGKRLNRDPLDVAQSLLGLSYDQAQKYIGDTSKRNGLFLRFDLKTPKQAAECIDKLITEHS